MNMLSVSQQMAAKKAAKQIKSEQRKVKAVCLSYSRRGDRNSESERVKRRNA